MSNPYSPPEADVAGAPGDGARARRPGWAIKAAIWLFFAFCTLQMWGVLLMLLHAWNAFGVGDLSAADLLMILLLPLCLFLGGVMLLFMRRASVVFLLSWLLASLAKSALVGERPEAMSIGIVLGALAMALSLWKRGHLR